MVRFVSIAAVVGCALSLSAFPVFAQDLVLPGLDLDPFHILTPAPPPPAAAAPVVVHHHLHLHHHYHHHLHRGHHH